ncbi:MAG: ComF family protein [Spirochaetes bacterium]|nr:ComF family protein [Spirochaetota bacterium]
MITARGICDQCRKSKFYYDRIRVAGIYDDILKQAIHLYKYSYRWKLISNFMDMIQKSIAKEYITDTDYIVPVPSTKMDIKKKGFNHTLFIAMNISKRYHVPYIKDLVKKTKETKPQSSLKRKERLQNLKDCFKFNKKYRNKLKNRNILLCDDVYTTGSTIQEVARELKKHGIRNIHVLTLARGL